MGYAITPEHIARDPKLSVGAKALWQVLASYASGSESDQRVWPSQETIAGHLGCTDRTVRTLVGELVAAAYIAVEQERTQRGVFSTYILHMGSPRITVSNQGPETGFRCGPERDRKQASAPDRKQASGEGSQLEDTRRIPPTEVSTRQSSLLSDESMPKAIPSNVQTLFNAYHELCPSLPKVRSNPDSAVAKSARSALKREPDIAVWKERFRRAEMSDFLTFRKPGNSSFKADLLWLLKPANTEKLDSGWYDNRGKPGILTHAPVYTPPEPAKVYPYYAKSGKGLDAPEYYDPEYGWTDMTEARWKETGDALPF